MKTIASTRLDDGLLLHPDAAIAEIIRDQDEYSGARVTLTGQLAAAHLAYATRCQQRWAAWLRKQHLTDRVPNEFGLILAAIGDFADPALLGEATGLTWNAARLTWVPTRAPLAA